MNKLSMVDILKTRTKVKIAGLLLVLLLVVLSVQFIISKNPKKSSAATTISSSKVIGHSNEYDGQDLIISGASTIVVLDGEHNFSSLTIESGATLTHTTVNSEGKTSYNRNFAVRWKGYIKVPINTDLNVNYNAGNYNNIQFGLKEIGSSTYLKKTTGWTDDYSTGHLNNVAVKIYQIEIDYKHVSTDSGDSWGVRLRFHDAANSTWRLVEANMLCQDVNCNQTGGLVGEYYAFTDRTAQDLANPIDDVTKPFSNYGSLVLTRTDAQINFGWYRLNPFVLENEGGLKLTVTNAVNLNSGGKIDVTGKGYAGGDFVGWGGDDNSPAYGPGAGNGLYLSPTQQQEGDGSGGGYGGRGAEGGRNNLPGGLKYPDPFDQYTTYLDYGSGGGGGCDDCGNSGAENRSKVNGGNGGGLVYINAQTINILSAQSTIIADGQVSSTHEMGDSDNRAGGGGGSGGTIWLASNNILFPTSGSSFNIFGGLGADASRGEIGSLSIFTQTPNDIMNISVKGGNALQNNGEVCTGGGCGGGGGGGRIILGIYNNYSVQKALSPISRTGVNPPTNFNPYALQKGDRIGVTLKIGGSATNLTVEDNWLTTSNLTPNYICEPVVNTTNPLVGITNPLIWEGINGGGVIYYECIVK